MHTFTYYLVINEDIVDSTDLDVRNKYLAFSIFKESGHKNIKMSNVVLETGDLI